MKKTLIIVIALIFCFSLSACSSNKDETTTNTAKNKIADEAIVNQTKDKIELLLLGVDHSPKDKDIVTVKAKNASDETITLDSITVIAYDKKLNLMDVSESNDAVKLMPNETSRKFSYTIKGKAAMIKITGYTYTQNGTTFTDTFDRNIIMHKNGGFDRIFGYYTDKQLLDKSY